MNFFITSHDIYSPSAIYKPSNEHFLTLNLRMMILLLFICTSVPYRAVMKPGSKVNDRRY